MKQTAAIALLLGLAMLLGNALALQSQERQPENGADIMPRIFGESRDVMSKRLLEVADKYYHGGTYAVACDHGIGAANDPRHEDAGIPTTHQPEAVDGLPDGTDPEAHQDPSPRLPGDWLSRINQRVYPSGHRHLAGQRYEKEILPWVWAAAKTDPNNVLAFNVGAFWLSERMGRPEEALKLLADGIDHNPTHAELEFNRGRILRQHGNSPAAAAKALARARSKWRAARDQWQERSAADGDEVEEPDGILYSRILVYSAETALALGNRDAARAYYQEAIDYSPNPDHVRELVRQLQDVPPEQP